MVIRVLRVSFIVVSPIPRVSLHVKSPRGILDINDSGLLSKLIFSGDSPQSKPVAVEVGMTEADFSGAILQQSGAMILAAWLKQKVQHDSD